MQVIHAFCLPDWCPPKAKVYDGKKTSLTRRVAWSDSPLALPLVPALEADSHALMVGSDDDPFDDFEFDDEALAVIEAEENKHFTQAAPRLAAPPAAKRQKTPQGWIARASSGAEEYDDLPDISINLDGSYALGNSAPPHSTQLGSAGPSTGVTQTKASVQPIRTSAPPRPPAASVLGSVRQTHIPTTNASIPSNSQTVTAPAHHAGAHSQRPFVPPRRMDNGENSQYQRGISIPRSQAPNVCSLFLY
jgi:hypothetical protein